MEQTELPNLPPKQSQRRYAEHNNELIVELIDIPVTKLAGAMLTLGNLCQLLTQSPEGVVQSNSDLLKMDRLLSFALLEMVSRTMSSHVQVKTLTSIWKVLARTSLSKGDVQLMRKLLRELDLMQSTDFTE